MPSDREYGPSKHPKCKFCDNQYRKVKETVGSGIQSNVNNSSLIDLSSDSSESESEQVDSH